MKKILSVVLSLCLLLSIFGFTNINNIEIQAATATLNYTSKTITKGKNVKLKVKNTNKEVKWSSSNKKIATVNSNGTVTGKSVGKANITAKVGDKKLVCKITVKKPSSSKSTQKVSNKVYWVDSGKVYHSTPNCRTLSKSKNIHSGTNPPSGRRPCKVC